MELSMDNIKEEVKRFRSSLKEEAIQTAEKSIRLEKRGKVGVIVFDQFQEKANKLSSSNMLRLLDLLLEVKADKDLGSLVLISRKPTIFIAGADINEIQRLAAGEGTVDELMKLQAIPTFLEALPIPSIAAIHGACMGGGTEVSLACDYRMASDAPETKIALPEVMLGLLPGWGGTQRLPKLVGLEKSLDMILTGKNIDAKRGKKMGLVDKVVPKEFLEEKAVAWAEELAKARAKRSTHHHRDLKEKLLETVPGGKWVIFDQAKKAIMKKTQGNYPAPLAALEVIKQTYGGSLEKGLRIEAEAFAKLVVTPESKRLIEIFFLTERIKKDKGVATEVKTKPVEHAAVVGAGFMGGGIAQLFAAKGVRVRMKDINWDAITKGYQAAYKVFKKLADKKRLKPNDLSNKMALIEGTTQWTGFKNVDVVVEAVIEDMNIKKKVFQDLETVVPADAVLATNTSSLSITELSEATKNPKRVVGMHFFSPVDKMPLVEVIRGKHTSDEAVSQIYQFAKKLGKTPIVVKDAPGFVVNRILGPYMNEAVYLLLDGVSPTRMDKVLEKFGMPVGPCTLLDEVGLDIAAKVSKVLYGAFGERMKPPQLIEKVTQEKRLGRKTGKGIYLYVDGKRKEDPELFQKLGVTVGGKPIDDETLVKRLTYCMINEGARVLEEELVRDSAELDIGMIFGTGFAPFRGGLLRYADTLGADHVVSELEILKRNLGVRFEPSNYLQQLAVKNKKFYA